MAPRGPLFVIMSLLEGILSLDDVELENQIVLLRTDLDTPLLKGGQLANSIALEQASRTIEKLQSLGARVVVASRFGEKKTTVSKKSDAPTIEPAAEKLAALCSCDVLVPDGCVGDSLKKVLLELTDKRLCVLENLAAEDDLGSGSEAFARRLASYIDVYIADSVRILDQASATTTQLPRITEFKAGGPALMKEVSAFDRINSGIDGPRVVIWGGNGLSPRLEELRRVSETAKHVVLVGVAANTMLAAQGGVLGQSAVEKDYLAGARTLAEQLGDKLVLPTDFICAPSVKADSGQVTPADRVPADLSALDLGPETQGKIRTLLDRAGTAVWCGTAGFHKSEAFAGGTRAICEGLAGTNAFTMVAGDDSVAAAHAVAPDSTDQIDCVALGGNAALSLLKDTKLVGLQALRGSSS